VIGGSGVGTQKGRIIEKGKEGLCMEEILKRRKGRIVYGRNIERK